jgi:hypothetical protein
MQNARVKNPTSSGKILIQGIKPAIARVCTLTFFSSLFLSYASPPKKASTQRFKFQKMFPLNATLII